MTREISTGESVRSAALAVGVLALNALAAVFAPSQSALVIALAGCVSALLIARLSARTAISAAALVFIVPLFSPWFSPQVAFLPVDEQVQIAVAWLLFSFVLAHGESPHARERGIPLFIAWASILWLLVVWNAGIAKLVPVDRNAAATNCSGDVLTWIFTTWDTYGASHLLFLPFRTPADYVTRTVYGHHSQAFLALMYGTVKGVQAITSKPLFYAINFVPFVQIGVTVVALVALLARDRAFASQRRTLTLVCLFLALGVVLTSWRFWHDMYTFSADNPFPFDGAWLVLLLSTLVAPARTGLTVAAAVALGAFNPYIAPAVLLALICIYGVAPGADDNGAPDQRRRALLAGAAMTIAGLAFFFLPRVLISWRGYQTWGSTLLVRSGLDGDTQHFTNIWQAIVAPCPAGCCGGERSVWALVLPAFVPLALAAVLAIQDRPTLASSGRRLAFVAAPYLFSVILFGQSVSIHPYLYDHLLMTPITVIGTAALFAPEVQKRLHGAGLLCAILVLCGIVMSNLVGITQSFAH